MTFHSRNFRSFDNRRCLKSINVHTIYAISIAATMIFLSHAFLSPTLSFEKLKSCPCMAGSGAQTIWPARGSTSESRAQTSAKDSNTNSPRHQAKRDIRNRVIAYYVHAVVAFDAYGIPLSSGPYLEYYYNTLCPTTRLTHLALIFGVQYFGTFAAESWAIFFYGGKHWRWSFYCACAFAVLCQLLAAFPFSKHWGINLAVRGLSGIFLGYLRGMSLLCLASHYHDNVAVVSMQSGAAAMAGAAVHSIVATLFFRDRHYRQLTWVNFGIVALSLTLSIPFMNKSIKQISTSSDLKRNQSLALHSTPQTSRHAHNAGILFTIGYLLIFFTAFVWPTFFPLLFSSHPIYEFPYQATHWLLALFGAAALASAYIGSLHLQRHLGAVNTFTAASVYAGLILLAAAWNPGFWVWGILTVLYGFCLPAILVLHTKVVAVFLGREPRRGWRWLGVHGFAFGRGVAILAGIGVAGMFIEATGRADVILGYCGGLLLVGGAMVGAARFCRYSERYVVV